MHPSEIWEMALWEYNAYMRGYEKRHAQHAVDSVLTGYYSAYYASGSKKVLPPQQIIRNLFLPKQTVTDGFNQIEKIKEYERRKKF